MAQFSVEIIRKSGSLLSGNQQASVADTVTVTVVAPGNTAPIANAGPDQSGIVSAATVTLDGLASHDPDVGQSLSSGLWTQTAGPTVTLAGADTPFPSFTAPTLVAGDADVVLTFSLVVTDNLGLASVADTVTITVVAPGAAANTAPVANAGADQPNTASAGSVTLDGSASSDPDKGQTLTYAWTQTAGTTVALSDATAAGPSFTAPTLVAGDADVVLTFSLVVTDNLGLASVADTVTITVVAPGAAANTAPVANAGADQPNTASAGSVTLDGSASSDPDKGQTLTYAWTQTAGTTVALSDATAAGPSFTAPTLVAGDADVVLTFSLVVTDNLGLKSTADTMIVTVVAPAATKPAPSAADAPAQVDGSGPFTMTIHFDQAVLDFTAADIDVLNGAVLSVVPVTTEGGSTDFIVTIQPNGAGDVEVSVAAGVAHSSAGMANLAMAPITIAVVAPVVDDHASETIASFMANRANHLVVNQPELAHFLMGGCEGHLDAKITQANGSVDFASDQCKQVWATLKGAHSTGSDASADYVLGVIGSHVAVNPNLLVGGMVQLDYASETKGAAKTSGHGWLVGPYVVSRMQSQPLVFEGRALFGQTDNRVSPLGTYEDRFTTNRSLIQAALTGEIIKGDTTYKPRFGLTSTSDHQQAYVDSNGTTIAAQDLTLTEVEAGLSVEQQIKLAQGKLLLKGGLTGIWAQTSGTAASLLDADYEGGRAKLDLGAEFALGETTNIGFSGYYDGLGAQNYQDWGVALNWETRF